MPKVITLFMIAGIVVGNVGVGNSDTIYPTTCMVFEIQDNEVSIETSAGILYTFTTHGEEDWVVGDCCSCIMDSMGTELIYDDQIVSVRYSGWDMEPID